MEMGMQNFRKMEFTIRNLPVNTITYILKFDIYMNIICVQLKNTFLKLIDIENNFTVRVLWQMF